MRYKLFGPKKPLPQDAQKAIDALQGELWWYHPGTPVEFDMSKASTLSDVNTAFCAIEAEFDRRAIAGGVHGMYKLECSGSYPIFTYVRRRV